MNEEKDLNKKDKIIEKTIKIEEIPKINPSTISKIILNDGTILVVETNSMENKENELKNINDIGASDNLKTKKEKKLFSYVEWDFPNTKKSYQRNSISELIGQNTNDNNNNEKNENINKRENSRDSAIKRNIKSKNYSFYESKHVSNKKKNNNNSEIEYKNSSCFIKNDNFKEIENNINDGEKENEKNINNIDNSSNNKISNIEKQEELVNINNSEQKDLNIKEQENMNNCSNKNKKDNLSFGEKIKLIKYGLLENDNDFNSSLMGLKNDDKDNNIQKINKIKPLNIDLDKNKNKNQEDINKQFNKLLQKFNENKKENNKKMFEDNSYLLYKTKGKDSSLSGLNDDINQLNNFINRGKYNNINSKKENNKGNSYRDLNERINQLRKKTLSNNLINFMPTRNSNSKFLVLPSNF